MLKPIKGHPGRYLDTSSGQVLNISEYREDDKYDTIVIYNAAYPGAKITAGKQYVWFRDIEKKLPIDTNFTQPSRMSMGEEMVVDRIGVTTECMMGGTRDNGGNNFADDPDIISVICAGHVRIVVNGLLLSEGPMIKYASGYGLSGYVSGTGVTFNGIFNIGVPSQASVPKLVKTQTLTERHEVIGFLTFYSRAWADAVGHEVNMPYINKTMFLPVKCWLHGLIKTAVNK